MTVKSINYFKKFGKIFQFIDPYKGYLTLGLFFLIFSSAALLAFPFFAGKLVDAASSNSNTQKDINFLAIGLLSILLVQSVFSYFRVVFFAKVSESAMKDLRHSLFSRLIHLPVAFFDKRRTGELISRITSDISLLRDTFSVTIADFFQQLVTLVIGAVLLYSITPKLTFLMFATFPILIIIAMMFGRHIRKLSEEAQDDLANANVIVEETLQSILTVKSFAEEEYESNRYKLSLKKFVNTSLNTAKFNGGFVSFNIFALFGCLVSIIWYGATLVKAGDMSIGDLVSFVLYTSFIGGSIAGLGGVYGQIQRAIGSSERVLEILDEPGEDLRPSLNKDTIEGNVQFTNVRFSYPTRLEDEVLKSVNFNIRSGEKIAIAGLSGAGKSTIVHLLLRFYTVTSGNIKIDGKDISEWNLKGLRSQIAIVPQEVLLFGGTIAENIAYAKPSASLSEIIDAAKKANAWDFISQFPEGLKTLVGERGIKLSGGQRQRIAIARAILKDPSLLILDEATSSLDVKSEYLVQEALEKLMVGRTTIIISHRLSTIKKVDRIYFLENGEIVEQGNHETLANMEGGAYAKLARFQF